MSGAIYILAILIRQRKNAQLRALGAYDLCEADHHPGYIIMAFFLRVSASDGVISSKRSQRKIVTFARNDVFQQLYCKIFILNCENSLLVTHREEESHDCLPSQESINDSNFNLTSPMQTEASLPI